MRVGALILGLFLWALVAGAVLLLTVLDPPRAEPVAPSTAFPTAVDCCDG
jgi:hypothetical protein